MMQVLVTTGAIRQAKLQSNHHRQQNQHPTFHRLDAFPVAQPCQSTEGKKYHIPRTCSPEAQLRVFKPCLCPLKASVSSGEGYQASRQPSDASTHSGGYKNVYK